MSQKYDEYLEKHRQAVKKAYQWIAAYIPELTDVEATRNIEFHDMSKNTPDEYTPFFCVKEKKHACQRSDKSGYSGCS